MSGMLLRSISGRETARRGRHQLQHNAFTEVIQLRTAVGVVLAVGLLVLAGGHLLPPGVAAPAPEVKKPPAGKDEIPPYDGKLRSDGETPMPQGGKVVLYSRNRHGNYPLAS